MCNLRKRILKKSKIGFKVVIKYKEEYYSPATGLCYSDYENKAIPTLKLMASSVRTDGFDSNILNPDSTIFKSAMQGRTSVFKSIQDAKIAYKAWQSKRFELTILLMEVYHELLSGTYKVNFWNDYKVYAGKRFTILKEVK